MSAKGKGNKVRARLVRNLKRNSRILMKVRYSIAENCKGTNSMQMRMKMHLNLNMIKAKIQQKATFKTNTLLLVLSNSKV